MTFRGFSKCICIVQNQVLHIYCSILLLIHMQCVEKQRHYFANKSPHSQDYGLPSGHVLLWELDLKEGRVLKNWCLRTVVLEKDFWEILGQQGQTREEIDPEYSLEGLMLKLKLQYFGNLMWTFDSLEKSVILGKIERRRRRGHQGMRWLDGITNAMDMNLEKLQEMVRNRGLACCSPWGHKELDTSGWLNNNTMSRNFRTLLRKRRQKKKMDHIKT